MNDLREQNENKSLVPANEKWIVLILSIGSNFVNHLRRWMTWFHFRTKLIWNVFRPHTNFKLQRFFYIMEAIVMTSGSCLQWFKIVFQKESYGRILIDHKKRNWTTYEIKIEQSQ